MKKIALLSFSLFCLSLFAAPEYDIVVLAPEGEEITSESDWECFVTMNDAGYITGSIRREDGDLVPYVYHPEFGFKSFVLPRDGSLEGEFDGMFSVNSHGIAVGHYNLNYDESICVCDPASGECYDLFNAFGTSPENRSLSRIFITDENKIVLHSNSNYWYWLDDEEPSSMVYIYDLNTMTAELFSEQGLADVNLKGQMVGADRDYDDIAPTNSWVFDPAAGLQKLGSIDMHNRWPVSPEALSENGVVAGIGLDSFREEKGFVWSPAFGMHSFDLFGEWSLVNGVNDKGTAIWITEVDEEEDDPYDRSFIFSLEKGSFDLGSLGGWSTIALGMNNHDQVVGISETKRGKDRAFIWDFEQGMRDLTTLIPKDSGWKVLDDAVEINNSGCIIGMGQYYGAYHHFLLIPRN